MIVGIENFMPFQMGNQKVEDPVWNSKVAGGLNIAWKRVKIIVIYQKVIKSNKSLLEYKVGL